MFRKPGAVLKGFTTALGLLSAIVSLCLGIFLVVLKNQLLLGVAVICGGLFVSALLVLILFCIGDMTEKLRFLAEQQGYGAENEIAAGGVPRQFYTDCPSCKNHIPLTDADMQADEVVCPYCGVKLKRR